METIEIRPQEGPQEAFLATPADGAIYGGQAGGGKSYGLLLEPTRHYNVKGFGGTIFRRTSPEITSQGGLWEESYGIYGGLDGTTNKNSTTYYDEESHEEPNDRCRTASCSKPTGL